MKLYEISAQHRLAAEKMNEMLDEGVIDQQTIDDTLEGLGFDEKASGVALYIRELMHEKEAAKAEAERLKILAERAQKNIDGFKNYLIINMQAVDKKSIKTSRVELSIRNSKAVEIFDENLIDSSFKKVKEVISIDKLAIKDALNSGSNVTGARLVTNQSLQIK